MGDPPCVASNSGYSLYMKYPKKTGKWHIVELFRDKSTICGQAVTPETRAVPYDFFPWTAEREICQKCQNHEDLPLIVLRTKA